MIWLTWRQFRVQATVVYAALAVLAVAVVATRGALADLATLAGDDFLQVLAGDGTKKAVFYAGFAAVTCLPAIVGIFWGAPLVARELETGTHRLAWNQTVTRTRWLAIKVGLTGLAAMAAAGALSLLVSWWCGPIDTAINAGHVGDGPFQVSRLSSAMFVARGIAPVGYTAFAFALGVAAGIVIRRTVPAMAVTLAVFVAVQIAMPMLVRPHLGPDHLTTTISMANFQGLEASMSPAGPAGPMHLSVDIGRPGAWIIANQTIDRSGHVVDALPTWMAECIPPPPGAPQPAPVQEQRPAVGRRAEQGLSTCFARLTREGYRQRVTYQPASSYWALQAYETAIFTGFALLLTGFSFWWLRHRLA